MSFGTNVKRRRVAAGLSLQCLAEQAGVSASMLSGVERDEKSPTIRVATQIADGLACTLSDLLDEGHDARPLVVRRDDGGDFVDPETGVVRRGLSPLLARRGVEPSWYTIPGGGVAGPFAHRDPQLTEHVTVVKGRLVVDLGGREISLRTGDSVTYPADVPHAFTNPGRRPAEYLHLAVTR